MTSDKITALENRVARERSQKATRAGRTDRRPHKIKLAIGAQLEDAIQDADDTPDTYTAACIAAGLAQALSEQLARDPSVLDKLYDKGRDKLGETSGAS